MKLERGMEAPVMLFYGLQNYLQNHRRMTSSRYDPQLRGEELTSVHTDVCFPYHEANHATTGINHSCNAIKYVVKILQLVLCDLG